MIAVCFISDRADLYLPACIESFDEHCPGDFPQLLVDDQEHHLGMAGAVRKAWEWALDIGADHLLHIEEDFTFNAKVPLAEMQALLDGYDYLAQVVLKRQPWSPEEHRAGGIIERHPCDYVDRDDGLSWVEHERIFSLNPCLIPRRALELGWPASNEAGMTKQCLANGFQFAFYGKRTDPPRVTHHGVHRSAGWRL